MLRVDLTKRRGPFSLEARFSAPQPGITALFGRSGCGKSTLISLIAGLLRPDTGRVELGDELLTDCAQRVHVDARHRRIGVVFQDGRLFPHLSVRGNLDYGAARVPRGAPQMQKFAEVTELLGLRALLERRPHQLSGGERQRVALGRALLSQPRLLLLDEPLASLDQARREDVLPYLERLRDAYAIPMLYVTHQFEEVLRLASRVVLLDAGRVLTEGDIATVSRDPRLRAIVGADSVGAVLSGSVAQVDATGLATLRIGAAPLVVDAEHARPGQRVQIQVLARDVIIATQPPQALSVRNVVPVRVTTVTPDSDRSVMVELDMGHGHTLLARITQRASEDLALSPGKPVWALIKAVSLRGHAMDAARSV